MTDPHKPPPKTVPGKPLLKKTKNSQLDLEISVVIVQDVVVGSAKSGETKYEQIGTIPDGQGGSTFCRSPPYEWEQRGPQRIVTKIIEPVRIKGVIKIQTIYGPESGATHVSAYGRGTTAEDRRVGNITLGFHESCHRDDYVKYLRNTPLPTFSGRVGMTEDQFKRAGSDFIQKFPKYFADMERYSETRTDEVGIKKSLYKLKVPDP